MTEHHRASQAYYSQSLSLLDVYETKKEIHPNLSAQQVICIIHMAQRTVISVVHFKKGFRRRTMEPTDWKSHLHPRQTNTNCLWV